MSDELTARLARRQKIIDGDEPAPTEGVEPKAIIKDDCDKGTVDAADNELANKLLRQGNINDGIQSGNSPSKKVFNIYTEFKEFSRSQIKEFEKMFKKYDTGHDGFIDFDELKYMMEKLGEPQTHLALKKMIKEVDEDEDKKISFVEFLLIFRKSACGELEVDGLKKLAHLSEIDVSEKGVASAASFFQAKANVLAESNKFEEEIKKEQEEKKKEAEAKKVRHQAFKAKAQMFQ